jgi:hypothetical protein
MVKSKLNQAFDNPEDFVKIFSIYPRWKPLHAARSPISASPRAATTLYCKIQPAGFRRFNEAAFRATKSGIRPTIAAEIGLQLTYESVD